MGQVRRLGRPRTTTAHHHGTTSKREALRRAGFDGHAAACAALVANCIAGGHVHRAGDPVTLPRHPTRPQHVAGITGGDDDAAATARG